MSQRLVCNFRFWKRSQSNCDQMFGANMGLLLDIQSRHSQYHPLEGHHRITKAAKHAILTKMVAKVHTLHERSILTT